MVDMGQAWLPKDWIRVHGSNLRACNVQQFRNRLVRKMGECTWCMGDTGSNRRRYCSEACRVETYVRCHPGSARYYVEKRDRGVCGGCGLDTKALFAKLARICNRKNDRGVEARVHYPIPVHLQEGAKYLGYKEGDFPVAERDSKCVVTLPAHQHLTDLEIGYTIEQVHSFYE